MIVKRISVMLTASFLAGMPPALGQEEGVRVESKTVVISSGKKGGDHKEATISYPAVSGLKDQVIFAKVIRLDGRLGVFVR